MVDFTFLGAGNTTFVTVNRTQGIKSLHSHAKALWVLYQVCVALLKLILLSLPIEADARPASAQN